jgi:hypothetical protein
VQKSKEQCLAEHQTVLEHGHDYDPDPTVPRITNQFTSNSTTTLDPPLPCDGRLRVEIRGSVYMVDVCDQGHTMRAVSGYGYFPGCIVKFIEKIND